MTLRDDLEHLAAGLTFAEGRAVTRIADVLESKGGGAADYWDGKGRERFRSELRQDAVGEQAVGSVIRPASGSTSTRSGSMPVRTRRSPRTRRSSARRPVVVVVRQPLGIYVVDATS